MHDTDFAIIAIQRERERGGNKNKNNFEVIGIYKDQRIIANILPFTLIQYKLILINLYPPLVNFVNLFLINVIEWNGYKLIQDPEKMRQNMW